MTVLNTYLNIELKHRYAAWNVNNFQPKSLRHWRHTARAVTRNSDCVYVHEPKEIPPRYINVARCIHWTRCSRAICWRRRCLARLHTVLSRHSAIVSQRRGSSRASCCREAAGSARFNQLDADDHAKFGKDAATHYSVEGPFLTVYR